MVHLREHLRTRWALSGRREVTERIEGKTGQIKKL